VDNVTASLVWAVGALEHALEHNQSKLAPYLIEVSEELVFEIKLPERRSTRLRTKYGL
jgi:hypothetical protein